MATAKRTTEPVKMTPAQIRKENEELKEKLSKYESYGFCYLCDKHKSKDPDNNKFYTSTDPMVKSGITPICKECARKIALRVDKNGVEHEPTKESVQLALRYLNKPFLNKLWDTSIQESENLIAGKTKSNVWTAYIKNVAMGQYNGLTYFDSDFFKEKIIYDDEKQAVNAEQIFDSSDYDNYIKNKEDVKRLLGYDPFENEAISDQPLLYGQLLGLLDAGGEGNEDMMRNASAISIVRGFLQSSKIDDSIVALMSDIKQLQQNSATIKSLQDSKKQLTGVIKDLAAESCISLKNNKNAKKGENTWTGKIKKIKELNLREGEVNGFDMATCKAMKQVMDLSNKSIMEQLRLDESEWSDIVADQRTMIVDLQEKLEKYIEISRILLRENLDIKDTLNEKEIDLGLNLVNLNELYSCFSEESSDESEGDEDEI